MSIEAQVEQLLAGQKTLTDAVTALTTAVAAIAAPTVTVDLSPVTTALTALDGKVSTILADITDPDDAAPQPGAAS